MRDVRNQNTDDRSQMTENGKQDVKHIEQGA